MKEEKKKKITSYPAICVPPPPPPPVDLFHLLKAKRVGVAVDMLMKANLGFQDKSMTLFWFPYPQRIGSISEHLPV